MGKSYYAVVTVPIALAQGLMAIGRVKRPRLRIGFQIAVAAACVLQLLTFAQLTLPITPPNRIHSLGLDAKNELFADSVGWKDVAQQVESIYGNLPYSKRTGTIIISAFYGIPEPVFRDYEALLRRYGTDYARVSDSPAARGTPRFFGTDRVLAHDVPNSQDFDFAVLATPAQQLLCSDADQSGFPQMMNELEHMFTAYQRDGFVRFEYRTRIFAGNLPSPGLGI